jgi:hypothetical protein
MRHITCYLDRGQKVDVHMIATGFNRFEVSHCVKEKFHSNGISIADFLTFTTIAHNFILSPLIALD